MLKDLEKIKILSLEETLEYTNHAVVNKFLESYNVTFQEAEELFQETKRWLWLCAYTNKSNQMLDKGFPNLFIDSSMMMLDEMWHTFILFTKEYHSFCKKYFGMYIHHAPTTKKEKDNFHKKMKEDKVKSIQESFEKSKFQYEYIYDLLGGDVLKKWYDTFAEKYNAKAIKSIRKV